MARLLSRLHRATSRLAYCALLLGSYSTPSNAAEAKVTSVTLVPSSLDLPDGLSAPELREALTTASQRWSYPEVDCTSVVIDVATAAQLRRAERDGRSLVVFRTRRWCHNEQCGPQRTFSRLAAAMTTVYDETAGAAVAEADVELNAIAFEWSPALSFDNTRPVAPLVPMLVHELGHVLGFKDTCGTRHGPRADPNCPRNELESVMLSGSNREQLTAWDVARLCTRFPRQAGTPAADARREQPGQLGALFGWLTLAAAAALAIGLAFSPRKDSR